MKSTRAMVMATAALALLAGGLQAAVTEADAIKAVENVGGRIIRDDGVAGRPVIGVDFSRTWARGAPLTDLQVIKSLRILKLKIASDEDMAEIKTLKNLRS